MAWEMPAWSMSPARHCADADPDLFFPVSRTAPAAAEAKALCEACPFRRPCLAFAMDRHEYGIWGGTDEVDRSRARTYAGTILLRRRSRSWPSAELLAERPALAYALGR